MMSCATLVWYFCGGAAPPCLVEIPRSQIENYTTAQVRWAKACAVKHGVKWRIVG